KRGGHVIATGSANELVRQPESVTGKFLAAPLLHPLHPRRPIGRNTPRLRIAGATLHNLKGLNVDVPIGRLVAVTGVSGSGKSTLARDVLYRNLQQAFAGQRAGSRRRAAHTREVSGCNSITGWEAIGRVLEVDQTPIGKTPRSCPATYVGFWNSVRKLYAEVPEARMRGYGPGRFSFNTKGGSCETCEGQGLRKIEMSFLPDVKVPCESCHGARFDAETLSVRFKDKSIGEVLAMNVEEAVEFFNAHPSIHHCLRLLQEVGLGYLALGQQSPTLSGGEAQRIKLVTELAKVRSARTENHTLYVLDEPTVGLHMADVEKLTRVLHQLVDAGNTVVVIEHNLDIMAESDWIIDLGPEGGDAGGEVVAAGTPDDLIEAVSHPDRGIVSRSHTARILADFLPARRLAA
ncbi:MAG TPA: excinuclease ABC subunit A, partial [Burkholderiales bacterium]|nr:excinuclease ABC subunit A [Burkholderiales bacterium]